MVRSEHKLGRFSRKASRRSIGESLKSQDAAAAASASPVLSRNMGDIAEDDVAEAHAQRSADASADVDGGDSPKSAAPPPVIKVQSKRDKRRSLPFGL